MERCIRCQDERSTTIRGLVLEESRRLPSMVSDPDRVTSLLVRLSVVGKVTFAGKIVAEPMDEPR